jgi:AraC family transcriptional activator of tynA and feaB
MQSSSTTGGAMIGLQTDPARSMSPGTRNRVAAWSSRFFAVFERAEIVPTCPDRFDATIETGELGSVAFARISCAGSSIDRVRSRGAVQIHSYSLIVQQRGTGKVSQYGVETFLQPGDLQLCDSAAPLVHHMAEGSELILVRIPAHVLQRHLNTPEQCCGQSLPGNSGTASVATALLTSICMGNLGNLPPAVQENLARQVLEMIAITFSMTCDTQVRAPMIGASRFAKARRFIEQHLRDPELGPQKIARALNISTRYLGMIFAAEKDSVSAYILRRRLEVIAHQLIDARWRSRSICEIAFDWGFNSAPHFSRSFRERFGLSPRSYRAQGGRVNERTIATCHDLLMDGLDTGTHAPQIELATVPALA